MSDFGDMANLGFKIAGAFALVAAIGVGTGGYILHKNATEEITQDALTLRILDEMEAQHSGVKPIIGVSIAQKLDSCPKEKPYGGTTHIKDLQGTVLAQGTYCTAPNKATVFKFTK